MLNVIEKEQQMCKQHITEILNDNSDKQLNPSPNHDLTVSQTFTDQT